MSEMFPVCVQTNIVSNGPEKIVYYPEIVGVTNKAWQFEVNNKLAEQTQQLIHMLVGDSPETVTIMMGSYEVKNNQRNILSITQSNSAYHYHAAHGMRYLKSLTFDMGKEKQYSLSELFIPGSDYVSRLSKLVALQIKQRGIETFEPFTSIDVEQSFYIADKTLVLYYQLYDITPYVFGFPIFPISVYDIADIVVDDGPLGVMAIND
ncbi:MAG TPA: DUF3298 and DUF4163 domain-containing protein [Candidatus Paenibacillus intestinavium]|nr:DUF3298 and DUF4163 domain-containing protein [Candidatus Paenibacillus intestinavium]